MFTKTTGNFENKDNGRRLTASNRRPVDSQSILVRLLVNEKSASQEAVKTNANMLAMLTLVSRIVLEAG